MGGTESERRKGSTGGGGGASSTSATPGKRTLTGGLQLKVQRKSSVEAEHAPVDDVELKDDSNRFEGDKELSQILAGAKTLKKGSKGLQVKKLQQALIDMGYLLPKFGVDAVFEDETETALRKFQVDASVTETGEFDKATLEALHKKYDTRKPYLDNATFDSAKPKEGVRKLDADDKKDVLAAMVPDRGPAGKFDKTNYATEIEAKLGTLIASFHKRLFEDVEPLRADPAKNFEKWSVLEATALESKKAVDAVYSSYATGAAMVNPTNFVDQWDDEIARNSVLSDPEKEKKARHKVEYLIVSNCADINKAHGAVPSGADERAELKPVVDKLVSTPKQIQTLLEIETGWTGAELEGTVYLQRYKGKDDAANRERLWKLFHTCIHEYIHALENDDYHKYAETFRAAKDHTRYNTLVEGMCDFFTDNVRATVTVTPALQKAVEGPYHDPKIAAPAVKSGSYPSKAQAEQVVAVVGVKNAQAAFFKGDVKAIGGP